MLHRKKTRLAMGAMSQTNQHPTASARAAFEAELAQELRIALSEATDGRINVVRVGPRGLALALDAGGKSVEVAVEVLRFAYPRDIHGAIWKLSDYQLASARPRDLILLVAAESLSPGAREQPLHRGIGYFERNGNLRLSWCNWLINVERSDPPAIKREVTSLFTNARERVIHALLVNRNRWTTGNRRLTLSFHGLEFPACFRGPRNPAPKMTNISLILQ